MLNDLASSIFVLRPNIVFVLGTSDVDAHFRGGDGEIIPVSDLEQPQAIMALMAALSGMQIRSFADLVNICAVENTEQFAMQIRALLDAKILMRANQFDGHNKLHRFLARKGNYNEDVIAKINAAKVYVWGAENTCSTIVSDCLRAYGLQVNFSSTQPQSETDMIVATGSFVTDHLFANINQYALSHEVPWFLVRQAGIDSAQFGPLFVPGKTACYECLQRRMASQRDQYTYYNQFQAQNSFQQFNEPTNLWLDSDAAAIAEQLAIELVYYFMDKRELRMTGKSAYIDLRTGEREVEVLLKLGSCPQCGQTTKNCRPS